MAVDVLVLEGTLIKCIFMTKISWFWSYLNQSNVSLWQRCLGFGRYLNQMYLYDKDVLVLEGTLIKCIFMTNWIGVIRYTGTIIIIIIISVYFTLFGNKWSLNVVKHTCVAYNPQGLKQHYKRNYCSTIINLIICVGAHKT